jgi:hypothetical protein
MESDWTDSAFGHSKISVEELDGMIKDYVDARKEYEEKKKVATDAHGIMESCENRVREALKALGKKSYKVEGLGTFTRVMKEVVTVPKDLDAKRQLFKWIEDHYGPDVLDSMRSINHQSLNSFYNQEVEKQKDNPAFEIPGLDAPTAVENVSFRKG